MLGDGETQMVTVVGPGGVGKTRLVVEFLTRRPPDVRVRFVDLAKLEHPEFVERTIAESLGIDLPDDLEPGEGLVGYFLDEPTLLVLDNYQQLLLATAVIDRLLASVAHLRLIVTSRLPLRSGTERLLWLEPLPLAIEMAAAGPGPTAESTAAGGVERAAGRPYRGRREVEPPPRVHPSTPSTSAVERAQKRDRCPVGDSDRTGPGH